MPADDLSHQGSRDPCCATERHRIRGAGHVRPPVGPDLGQVLRAGHAEAAEGRHLQIRLTPVTMLQPPSDLPATLTERFERVAARLADLALPLPPDLAEPAARVAVVSDFVL